MFLSAPRPQQAHLPHIVRIKSGQTLNARLAGDPLRVLTHYHDGRTYPCLKAANGECPLCDAIANPRYYAYWPISGSTGNQAAVELTELAELQLLAILPPDRAHFGQLVTFHRPSGRRNNPVQISLPLVIPNDEEARQKKLVPVETHRVQLTLFRLWCCPPRDPCESIDDYLERIASVLHCRYLNLVGPRRVEGEQRDQYQ